MVKSLLFGLTIGSVSTLLAMQYHLVRTDERLVIVSRVHQPPLRSAYVDIRNWNPAMWEHFPELQEAVIKAGRQDLMVERAHPPRTDQWTAPAGDDALPFHDVSKTGPTPIFTASESRSQLEPKSTVNSAKMFGGDLLAPHIALGPPQPSPAPSNPVISSPYLETNSIFPRQTDSVLHGMGRPDGMDRTVPNPVDIQQPGGSSVMAERATQVLTDHASTSQKRSWMQSLLRSIVPGAESTSAQETATQLAPAISRPSASVPGTLKQSFPFSPAPLPSAAQSGSAQQFQPEAKAIREAAESSFPFSPRRLPLSGARDL